MKDIRYIWKPLAVALLLRVVWSLLVPVMPVSDSGAYVSFSRTLIEHGVFGFEADRPFAFWPPGTSFLYAAVFATFGDNLQWAVPVNILMSLAIIWTSARVASRLYSREAAVATAWVIALWPTLIVYSTIVASELPFVLLITLAIDVWTEKVSRGVWRAALAGALLGAAALVRPLALIFPFLLIAPALWAFLRTRAVPSAQLLRLAVAVITMFMVITPWAIRNSQIYHRTVLISTNGGITFWMGNTPGTNGGYMDIPAEMWEVGDAHVETRLREEAWQYIKDEPGEFVKRSVWKAVKLYATETIGIWWNEPGIIETFGKQALHPMKIVTQAGWMAVLLLALIGAWDLFRKSRFMDWVLSPVVLPIAAFTVIHAVTVSQDRYHLGFFSLLAILAGAGWLACRRILRSA